MPIINRVLDRFSEIKGTFLQRSLCIALCSLVLFPSLMISEALIADHQYAVILERVSDEGEGMIISTELVTANANGVIEYAFTNVPNCSSKANPITSPTNFLIVSIISADERDSFQPHNGGGFVVASEKSSAIFPAPASGNTINLGSNNLTYVQTEGIMRSFKVTQTDDPLLALIGMVVYRSETLSKSDIQKIALALADQIFYPGQGFYDKLKEVKVTDAQISQFKSAIVCEDFGEDAMSFKKYMAKTYDANQLVVQGGVGQADAARLKHIQAGEELGGILINAASVVDPPITLMQLLHAVESIEFENTDGYTFASNVQTFIDNSLKSFFSRIRTEGQSLQWASAMLALNASSQQIDYFNSAVRSYLDKLVAARSESYNDTIYDQIEYEYFLDIQASSENINALVQKIANYVGYNDPNSYFYQNYKVYGYDDETTGQWVSYETPIIPTSPVDHWFFDQFTLNRVVWFDFYYTQENGTWKYNKHLIPRSSIVQLLAFNFIMDYIIEGKTHSYKWVSTPWPWDYSGSYTDSNGNYVSVKAPRKEAFTECESYYDQSVEWNANNNYSLDPSDPWYIMSQLYVIQDIQYALDNLGKWRSVAYLPELEQYDTVSYATKCYPLFFELIKSSWTIDIPTETKDHIINLLLGPQTDEVDQVSTQNTQSTGNATN